MPNFVISDQQIAKFKNELRSLEETIHSESPDHFAPAATSFIQSFSEVMDALPITPSKEESTQQKEVQDKSVLLRDCCEILLKVNRQLTQGLTKEAGMAVSSFIQSRKIQAS